MLHWIKIVILNSTGNGYWELTCRFTSATVDTPSPWVQVWYLQEAGFRRLAEILICRYLWIQEALHLIYNLHSVTTTPHYLWGINPLQPKDLGAAEVGKGGIALGNLSSDIQRSPKTNSSATGNPGNIWEKYTSIKREIGLTLTDIQLWK